MLIKSEYLNLFIFFLFIVGVLITIKYGLYLQKRAALVTFSYPKNNVDFPSIDLQIMYATLVEKGETYFLFFSLPRLLSHKFHLAVDSFWKAMRVFNNPLVF